MTILLRGRYDNYMIGSTVLKLASSTRLNTVVQMRFFSEDA